MDEIRLIDANALKKKIDEVQYTQEFCIEHQIDYSISMQMLGMIIENAPTVEQEVFISARDYGLFLEGYKQGKKDFARPQGEWEYNQYDGNPNIGNWHCSECRHIISGKYSQYPDYNFCPNCGAKMKGEEE